VVIGKAVAILVAGPLSARNNGSAGLRSRIVPDAPVTVGGAEPEPPLHSQFVGSLDDFIGAGGEALGPELRHVARAVLPSDVGNVIIELHALLLPLFEKIHGAQHFPIIQGPAGAIRKPVITEWIIDAEELLAR